MTKWRTAIAIAIVALVCRVAAILVAHFAFGLDVKTLPYLRDGRTYLAYADALTGGRESYPNLNRYDRRAFPGFPLLLAALRVPRAPLVGVALSALAAAIAAALTFRLYGNARVALAMAVLTPSYLMYSTVLMSEPIFLCLGLAALLAGVNARPALAGLLLGMTAIIRPLAAPIGLAYAAAHRRKWRELAISVACTLVIIVMALIWMRWWSGAIMAPMSGLHTPGPRGYSDGIFALPMQSLITTSLSAETPSWKIAYIWFHVVVIAIGIALLVRELPRDEVALAWLGSNTLIVLCIGGAWGFHEFHRFITPALPPLFYAYRRFLPRRAIGWVLLAALSATAAAKGLSHGW
jgi:hypothetical protein